MDAKAAIRVTVGQWTDAALDRDWDALIALCTNDVVFAPPGEPSVSGGHVRPWLEAFPVMREFKWDFERIDVDGMLTSFGMRTRPPRRPML